MTDAKTLNLRFYELFAVLLVGFSLHTAAFGVFPDVIQRGFHLGLALVLVLSLIHI